MRSSTLPRRAAADKADPLLTDRAYDELRPWVPLSGLLHLAGDRTIVCTAEAPSGTTTGTALK